MKTAGTIERQEARKEAEKTGHVVAESSSPASTQPAGKESGRGDASRIAPWRWPKGVSGNLSGAKHDLAREIARAVFEQNAEALHKAYAKAALRGNAYCFKELADGAYGKLREVHQVDIPFRDVSSEDLAKEIKRLEVQLGYRKPEEAVPVLPPADESKPN